MHSSPTTSQDCFQQPCLKPLIPVEVYNMTQQELLQQQEDPSSTEAIQCSICLESWTLNGPHRIVSLKCGHLFGKRYLHQVVPNYSPLSCIEKWLKNSGTCPQCKSSGRMADIRAIYALKIVALDTAEKVWSLFNVAQLSRKRRRRSWQLKEESVLNCLKRKRICDNKMSH